MQPLQLIPGERKDGIAVAGEHLSPIMIGGEVENGSLNEDVM